MPLRLTYQSICLSKDRTSLYTGMDTGPETMTEGHMDFLEPLGKQSYLEAGDARWIAIGLSYKGQRQTLR